MKNNSFTERMRAWFFSLFSRVKILAVRLWQWTKRVSARLWRWLSSLPWKRIGMTLLFPGTAVTLVLVPLAALFLIYMLINGDGGPFSIASYILSFYALVIVSARVPEIITFIKKIKNGNKYLNIYFSDPELRARISLYGALVINIAYAIFQVGLGLVHSSLWYYSLGGYYIMLSLMRFFLVRHDRKGEEARFLNRQAICRLIGVFLLVMTLVLSGVILHMIQLNVTIVHHEITTIALAAYTFTALTLAIVQIARKRRSKSLVFMVSKAISLVCALVSIITLENAMITAFGEDDGGAMARVMVAITGAVVCAAVVAIAVYIIVIANKRLQNPRVSKETEEHSETADVEKTESNEEHYEIGDTQKIENNGENNGREKHI